MPSRLLAAALAGALFVAGCDAGSTGSPGPRAGGGPPTAGGSTRSDPAAASLDPSRIVLQRSDAPPGTTYQPGASGPQDLDALVRGDQDAAKEKVLLRRAGFTGAYLSLFTGLQLPEAVREGHLVESFAVIFDNPASARRALRTMFANLSATGHSVVHTSTGGLPPGAIGVRAELTTITGHSYFYGWTAGNAAQMLIDAGADQAVDADASLRLAEKIAQTAPPGAHGASSVGRLVLPRDEAPPGTRYDPARSGPKTAGDLVSTPAQAASLARLGLESAYASAFLSPGFLHPTATPSTTGGQGNFVASQVQRYGTAADAHRAYELFRAREQRLFGSRMHVLRTAALGADATAFQYVDPKSNGDIYGFGYFWRRANLVLSLFDVGSAGFARAPEAHKLVQIMDSRTR